MVSVAVVYRCLFQILIGSMTGRTFKGICLLSGDDFDVCVRKIEECGSTAGNP